jgi:PKD repeat protein
MVWKSVLTLIAVLSTASSSLAQNYPLPSKVGEPAAVCTACPGNNAASEPNTGKPTVAYDAPLSDFVGRIVDSNSTGGYQHDPIVGGFRTARAGFVRPAFNTRGTAPPRLYIAIGQAIGAYSLDTFFTTKLAGGVVPLNAVADLKPQTRTGRTPIEKISPFDAYFYPETKGTGWSTPLNDNIDRLHDLDFDDRGFVYGAFDEFGWGIVTDHGEKSMAHFASVVQVPADLNGINPRLMIVLKSNSKYYATISDPNVATRSTIYDVTNPAVPLPYGGASGLRDGAANGISAWSKHDDARVLALLNGDGKLRLYDYDTFVAGGAPREVHTPSSGHFFKGLSFDDQGNLWVAESATRPTSCAVIKLAPAGGSYTKTTFTPFPEDFAPRFLNAGAGYLAVGGQVTSGGDRTNEVFLFKIENGGLRYLDTNKFFRQYYHAAPSGYAGPGGYTDPPQAVQIIKYGTKTYLMYNAFGLGDVYQLGNDGPQLSAVMKTTSFGTVNPNAQPTQPGPFPGDLISFNAVLVPAASQGLTWNFGNTEAGSTGTNANVLGGSTGIDATHQYTGLNTAAKVTATKTVTATSNSDSDLNDSLNVILKLPEARIAIKATAELVTGNGFQPIFGDKFADASDGSVESHVSVWKVDAATTPLRPDQGMLVGALGSHTVEFAGHYGKYDNTTLALPSQAYVASLTSRTYEVRPFVAKLNPISRSGSVVTYSATARYSTDPAALSATQWTVTWSLKTGIVETASQTGVVAVGTIPSFSFDKALLVNNSTVKLHIAVDPSTVPAPTYATYDATIGVTVPDPVVQLTNCGHVGDNCSIKAISGLGNPITGWSLSWVVKRGTTTIKSGTGNPLPTFKLDVAGEHTVTVTESVFDIPVVLGFTVDQTLCGDPPNVAQMSITPSCVSCSVNTVVTFNATPFQYGVQDCDVFSWTFGDGGTASGLQATHTYTSSGTYTVTLKVKNTTNTVGTTFTKSITVSGEPPPPCSFPSNINFSYTGNQGCAPGSNCKVGEQLHFTPHRGTASLATCDGAQWSFGDASTSTSKGPNKTYNSAGTFTVTLVVSNTSGQSQPVTQTVTVIPTTTGCSAGPTEANVTLRYTGKESGCTKNNGVPCKAGEAIDFEAGFFQYAIQACDRFEWTFNDGSAVGTAQNPTHNFPSDRTSVAVSVRVYNSATPTGVTLNTTVSFGNIVPAEPAPKLSLVNFPTTGAKGNAVTFNVSSDLSATGWEWDFGDGTAKDKSQAAVEGTTASIQHTYTKTGTFSVSVKARNTADHTSSPQIGSAVSITGIVVTDTPEYKFMLPVVTHGPGQNNSVWRTDVQIYTAEPGISPQNPLKMTASLRDISRNLEVYNPTFMYEDFMRVFTNANDSGPVIITVRSQTAPQIWTRTYNQTDTGTFGQFIPAVRIDAAAGGGSAFGTGKYYIAGLRHDDRFRTNLGFVNPNAQAVNATVRVYDDTRLLIGQFALQLQPYQLDQFPITADKAVKNLPPGRPFSLQIEVPPGQWLIAYASFIDSASNDPVYIGAVRESELTHTDYNSIAVPGVGHVVEWRSDVTIFNPDADSVVVDLAYYDSTGAKVAEAKSIQIRSGEFLQYTDLIKQGVFGNLPDSLGVLRVTTAGPFAPNTYPLTFARTYNDKGNGKTFGQGIGGFAVARANVKPGKPALVPGVRSNSKYYTNVGLTNVSAVPVRAFVKLLDPTTGAEQIIQTHDLQPNQSIVSRIDLGNLETGSLKIDVTGGNIWAFGSIVDKGTADPEYISATPLQ